MKTVNIKGKKYVEVSERLKHFRSATQYAGYSLTTKMLHLDTEWCCMVAAIYDADGRKVATGTAYEKADSTYINKTSYIENCETSAWGRALGNLGIGIDAAVCSADEVVNAINNQGECISADQVIEIEDLLKEAGKNTPESIGKFLKWAGAESIEQIPAKEYKRINTMLKNAVRKVQNGDV